VSVGRVQKIEPAFSSRFAIVEIEHTPKAFSAVNSIIGLNHAYPDAAHAQSPGSSQHTQRRVRLHTRQLFSVGFDKNLHSDTWTKNPLLGF
jgi:hypothetical protein